MCPTFNREHQGSIPCASIGRSRKRGKREFRRMNDPTTQNRNYKISNWTCGFVHSDVVHRQNVPAYIRAAGGSVPSVAISTLSRRWSARLSEAQEDSVRFRGESPGKF